MRVRESFIERLEKGLVRNEILFSFSFVVLLLISCLISALLATSSPRTLSWAFQRVSLSSFTLLLVLSFVDHVSIQPLMMRMLKP